MSKIRIALVEDERIVALHLRQIFIRLGYEVVSVSASGVDALSKIIDLKPDIVFMDIRIEGELDGIETAGKIPDELNIPVIYLSAYSEEETLDRAKQTKPYGYLLKPFTERELHSTVLMALERRNIERDHRTTEERLDMAMMAGELGYWELDGTTGQFICVESKGMNGEANLACSNWKEFMDTIVTSDRKVVRAALAGSKTQNNLIQLDFRQMAHNGPRWLRAQGKVFKSDDLDQDGRLIGVIQDITHRMEAEAKIRLASVVFENVPNGILILDQNHRVIHANVGFFDITGYNSKSIVGETPDFIDMDWFIKDAPPKRETIIKGVDGQPIPVLLSVTTISQNNIHNARYILILTDMTDIREVQAEREHLAYYDSLTNLPNRFLALDRLSHALLRCEREGGSVAVLFVDVDHFKRVNDTLGHSFGDKVLCSIASTMRARLRASDTLARLGGDEFMILLEYRDGISDVERVVAQIIEDCANPISMEDIQITVSVSIGISFYPKDAQSRDDLIRAADTAMYVAKEGGRNCYSFYNAEMQTWTAQTMERVSQLRTALRTDQLVLHFQPQVNLQTKQVIGTEALVRWNHPDHGLLGAGEVVPLAEGNGLIEELGQWVMLEAARHVRLWLSQGLPPIRMAVNVAAAQMRRGRVIETVKQALQDFNLDPHWLEVEITESMLQNEKDCITSLQDLRKMGLSTAIDDFGTGFSCMSSLKILPIDCLKVDQAFVRDIPHDRNDAAITEAIIALAKSLGLRVTAEGVETTVQLNFLNMRGCDDVQGYLLSRPMPSNDFVAWYKTTLTK